MHVYNISFHLRLFQFISMTELVTVLDSEFYIPTKNWLKWQKKISCTSSSFWKNKNIILKNHNCTYLTKQFPTVTEATVNTTKGKQAKQNCNYVTFILYIHSTYYIVVTLIQPDLLYIPAYLVNLLCIFRQEILHLFFYFTKISGRVWQLHLSVVKIFPLNSEVFFLIS